MRILLVEDDLQVGESVREALRVEGYAVDWLTSGKDVVATVGLEVYDLLLLDQRLPELDGLEILRRLRREGKQLPILVLTAHDGLGDKVAGLDAGADDYLTKPFEMDELFARMRSLLRRSTTRAPRLVAGEIEIDPAARAVVYQGETIPDLTAKEYAILDMLVRNRGRFITKARLLESCNEWDQEVESNTVEVYISRLRKRLGSKTIETLRGVGYRIQ